MRSLGLCNHWTRIPISLHSSMKFPLLIAQKPGSSFKRVFCTTVHYAHIDREYFHVLAKAQPKAHHATEIELLFNDFVFISRIAHHSTSHCTWKRCQKNRRFRCNALSRNQLGLLRILNGLNGVFVVYTLCAISKAFFIIAVCFAMIFIQIFVITLCCNWLQKKTKRKTHDPCDFMIFFVYVIEIRWLNTKEKNQNSNRRKFHVIESTKKKTRNRNKNREWYYRRIPKPHLCHSCLHIVIACAIFLASHVHATRFFSCTVPISFRRCVYAGFLLASRPAPTLSRFRPHRRSLLQHCVQIRRSDANVFSLYLFLLFFPLERERSPLARRIRAR